LNSYDEGDIDSFADAIPPTVQYKEAVKRRDQAQNKRARFTITAPARDAALNDEFDDIAPTENVEEEALDESMKEEVLDESMKDEALDESMNESDEDVAVDE
jgi:hypothetical protein